MVLLPYWPRLWISTDYSSSLCLVISSPIFTRKVEVKEGILTSISEPKGVYLSSNMFPAVFSRVWKQPRGQEDWSSKSWEASFHIFLSGFVSPVPSLSAYSYPLFSRHIGPRFLHITLRLPGALMCHTSASQPAIHQILTEHYNLLGTVLLGAGDGEVTKHDL